MTAVRDAWIVAGARTPIGRLGGALSAVRADDLAAHVLRAVVARAGVSAAEIDDVVLGCANQAGEDNRDVARMAALLADYPESVPGVTVNRLCGSGMEAVATAARAIALGDGDVYVAGGVESMSRAPWVVSKPARGFPTGPSTMHDTSLGWRLVNPEMEARGHTDPLGVTAENLAVARWRAQGEEAESLARPYRVDRAAQDRFALASHRKAVAAADGGRFDEELAPLELRERQGARTVDRDEGPRADTSLDALARLRAAFVEGGSVTAGNSSPLNDGAAALLLTSAAYAQAHGLRPLARIRSTGVAGVPPRVMGIGPVPAARLALDRAGLTMDDVDVIELNEAFAAQALACLDGWGVDPADERVNPNGGAIALGHPLGCSGARLVLTLAHELRRRDASVGLASMCIGVGQGIATVVERVA